MTGCIRRRSSASPYADRHRVRGEDRHRRSQLVPRAGLVRAGPGRTAPRGWPSRRPPAGRPGVGRRDRRTTSRTAPKIADSGTTRRAGGPTSRRTTCGTTSPTNPIRPVMATAAAVAIDASTRRIRRSRLTSTPRWLAAVSPSRNPSSDPRPKRRAAGTRRGSAAPRRAGASTRTPPRPPSRNEKICPRFAPETYIAIVSSAARTELIA